MALLILALLQRIFLMSSLMLLLVWLIFFMVLIKLLPILGTISGKTVKLMVLALKKVISRRNIRRRITIPLTLSNLKLLRRITRTENILHRNFTRRQVAIQNRVASNIGISQSTFSVKVLNLFSRSRRKTNKRKSKHSAMLRNKETRHRM